MQVVFGRHGNLLFCEGFVKLCKHKLAFSVPYNSNNIIYYRNMECLISNFPYAYAENFNLYMYTNKKNAHFEDPPPCIFPKSEGLVELCEHFYVLTYIFCGGSLFARKFIN